MVSSMMTVLQSALNIILICSKQNKKRVEDSVKTSIQDLLDFNMGNEMVFEQGLVQLGELVEEKPEEGELIKKWCEIAAEEIGKTFSRLMDREEFKQLAKGVIEFEEKVASQLRMIEETISKRAR